MKNRSSLFIAVCFVFIFLPVTIYEDTVGKDIRMFQYGTFVGMVVMAIFEFVSEKLFK